MIVAPVFGEESFDEKVQRLNRERDAAYIADAPKREAERIANEKKEADERKAAIARGELLLLVPTNYPMNPQLLQGTVQNVTHLFPRIFIKPYLGEQVVKVYSDNGTFINRIRVEDVLEVLLSDVKHLWQQHGWDVEKMRYEIVCKSSTQGFGFSSSPSTYSSQTSSKPGETSSMSQSVGGSLGYNSSLTNPQYQVLIYLVVGG